MPNYIAFVNAASWGDWTQLRQCLDRVWQHIGEGPKLNEVEAERLKEVCTTAAPDADDFPEAELAGAAQEAAFMVAVLLEMSGPGDVQNLVRICSFGRDTIDRHVQHVRGLVYGATDFETVIANDPMMQREAEKELDDLEHLRKNDLSRAFVRIFKEQACPNGKSNIGI
jgi:uncharacterized protein YjaG (DUF416 family)